MAKLHTPKVWRLDVDPDLSDYNMREAKHGKFFISLFPPADFTPETSEFKSLRGQTKPSEEPSSLTATLTTPLPLEPSLALSRNGPNPLGKTGSRYRQLESDTSPIESGPLEDSWCKAEVFMSLLSVMKGRIWREKTGLWKWLCLLGVRVCVNDVEGKMEGDFLGVSCVGHKATSCVENFAAGKCIEHLVAIRP
ncbi:nodulin MtN21 /EamA-like transporter family protein [Striga asiatica]|uniref:Nodulin MtN21 /EamA-like transporter family protein n=1 Tax=Striga asiatica TaxID=4170 RepID=A0A5A7PCL9_STRAF|nr:nodulin MtN21 /EamA-like transporter family protein [Striga asiatica]